MPTDFDWIFKRDPYWRERPKKEPPAIPRNQRTDARARDAVRITRPKSANRTGVTAS